ncbi:NADPH-dependent FMN reductase family protein, partial [Vibrio parahaemolyticus AQ3810]
TLTWSRVRL